jgi:hypothetical protein
VPPHLPSLPGTAGPSDYDIDGAYGAITFLAGATEAVLVATPKADTDAEGGETVVATLQPGTGYNVVAGSNTVTGTIFEV